VFDEKLLGAGVRFGVAKSKRALKETLNRTLAELKSDGTIDQVASKYFDVKVVVK
jgi:lysine/arginine/ornithine transport system substrate-binding protein